MAVAPAKAASSKAPTPRSSGGAEPDPAVPPWPVFGAPFGMMVRTVVVVVGAVVVVTGTVVVVVGTVVVVVVDVVVVVTGVAAHVGTVMVFPSRVTAPVCVSTRPFTCAPEFKVAEVSARIVPANEVVVPSVADEPTCQNTLHACAPPSSVTTLPLAVVNVDALWRMNTAAALPPALSVSVPVSDSALA